MHVLRCYKHVLVIVIRTWKTLGALIRLVKAEDTVAAKIPAVTIGPYPDTRAIT